MLPNSCRSGCACAHLLAQPRRKLPKKAERGALSSRKAPPQRPRCPPVEHYLAAGEGRAGARPHSGPPALIKRTHSEAEPDWKYTLCRNMREFLK